MAKKILLYVMLKDRFVCQLKYEGMTSSELIVPVYDARDIKKFVYEKRPSLIGKDIKIAFAKQKVGV